MTFTVTPLLDGGMLVEGTDSKGVEGTTILYSERWAAVQHVLAHKEASAVFDEAVQEFFKPITEAADAAKAAITKPANKWNTVVLNEGVEGKPAESIELDSDGILLRILAAGGGDQLRWVNDGMTLVAVLQ